ncbi:MAG: carbon storage regulator [Bdellovibrio sp.]
MKRVRDPKYSGALILNVKLGAETIIGHGNESMVLTVVQIKGHFVRLCFKGPKSFAILRSRLIEKLNEDEDYG